MARPRGERLNRSAFDDLVAIRLTSDARIATAAELSFGALSDLKHGRRRASREVAARLAAALQCNPATLFPTLIPEFAECDPLESVA